jgi:cytidylate kinase
LRRLTIAIDGPVSSGKSTIARRLARELGYLYIDTGAMYRAVAWKVRALGLDPADAPAIASAVENLDLVLRAGPAGNEIQVDGREVTAELRTEEISRLASRISTIPAVRDYLVARQKRMGAVGGVVMEGRDIQTVVLPNADLKIFLSASTEERARRRCAELQARGVPANYEEVLRELQERDARDSTRAHSPLRPADDAVTVDTTDLTIEQVIEKVLARVRERRGLDVL